MPPKNKEGINGYTQSTRDPNRYFCDICTQAAPPGKDLAKGSTRGHPNTKEHRDAIAELARRENERRLVEEQRRQYREQRGGASGAAETVVLKPIEVSKARRARPTIEQGDFWADFDYDASALDMPLPDPSAEDLAAHDRARIQADLDAADTWNDAELGFAFGADREEEQAQEDERQVQEMLDGLSFDEIPATDASQAKDWYPYPSKVMFLLNAADNLPRLRISEAQMKLFLYILKECGVANVPNITSLRKFQKSLQSSGSGVPTVECKSVQGNIFHVNDVRRIIANDWTNPSVRPHIRVYPEIPPNGVVSEMWHASKWRSTMDRSKLSPMYAAADQQHYYIDELAQLKSGKLVIPVRWVTKDGPENVCANAFEVAVDEEETATVLDSRIILVSAAELKRNFLALEHQNLIPVWSSKTLDAGYNRRMPHPKRAKAGNHPYYVSQIIFFNDDVSGNRSKSWNKHWVEYFTHASLPRTFHHQEAHIHFVSTSQHASIPEQFNEVKRLISTLLHETETTPIIVWDPQTRTETALELGVFADALDNLMQSKVCSHRSSQSNFANRKSEVGGTQAEKHSDVGYHNLFSVGQLRTWTSVLTTVAQHLLWGCWGKSTTIEDDKTDTGTGDPYAQFWIDKLFGDFKSKCAVARRADPKRGLDAIELEVGAELDAWVETRYHDLVNPFFLLRGFDPTQDTPVKILHTILLGIVKYIWFYSHNGWNPAKKLLYSQRLQASSISGLSVPPIRAAYIMQYAEYFATWKAVGQLAALLWVPEIDNMAVYREDLTVAIANMLDAFAAVDPSKMITKFKLQLLPHIPRDAERFGRLVGVATENFESFNAVFRAASIHSNHQAPSRDIVLQLAAQEGTRHHLFGGYWRDSKTDVWVRAGPAVRDFVAADKSLQRMLGLNAPAEPSPGKVKLAALPKREAGKPREKRAELRLANTISSDCAGAAPFTAQPGLWNTCTSIISRSGGDCRLGSWVFYDAALEGTTRSIGRIRSIYFPISGGDQAVVVLERFKVEPERHLVFDMPVLVRENGPETQLVVASVSLFFLVLSISADESPGRTFSLSSTRSTIATSVTVLHLGAGKSDRNAKRQSSRRQSFNIATMRSFSSTPPHSTTLHLLRRVLPRHLTCPIALHPHAEEREAFHHGRAALLREKEGRKRKLREDAAAAKAQEAVVKEAEAARLREEALEITNQEGSDERPTRRRRVDEGPAGMHDEGVAAMEMD
ncbi:hypothetical protein HMN09_01066900 [Mycena chlorophos]|uniref:Uncharacterized protein n=1 Tax=Mycena chlorophos TaxID=658473 RepID=A0A8H6VWH8_MYCCL|nr:hypothetical protein HMN09_01066900 [Mycena chlorophos]